MAAVLDNASTHTEKRIRPFVDLLNKQGPNAIVGNNGQESQCGWCKDKWDVSWKITPHVLTDALAKGGYTAKRAFEAIMPMNKIDVCATESAVRG